MCGDGVNSGTVECDDGNLLNGDGCDVNCVIEGGYACSHPNNGRDTCYEICGDGVNLGFFPCDDGNFINGDGCSSTCQIETCWTCNGGSPTSCVLKSKNIIGITNITLTNN